MIVPMKKVQLVVLKEDKERLLLNLQKAGVIMLLDKNEEPSSIDTISEESIIQRTEKTLKLLKQYQEKNKKMEDKVISYDDFISDDPAREALLTQIEATTEEKNKLVGDNTSILDFIQSLNIWKELDIPLDELQTPKYAIIHVGTIEPRYLGYFQTIMSEHGCEYQVLGKTNDGQAICFANYLYEDSMIMEQLRSLSYSEVALPKLPITVAELIKQKENEIAQNLHQIETLEKKLEDLSNAVHELELLNDQTATRVELKKAPHVTTDATVYLEGWARSDRLDKIEKAIKETTEFFDLEISDPTDDEMPPTVTKNNKFVEPFEIITNMFALPNPREVDPNPVMSIWYWLIFGIMMGDFGYGILMAVIFSGLIAFKRPKGTALKLYKLLLFSSITTAFWGFLFGSYFGFTLSPILLVPMDDPLFMLFISVVIGILHIVSGLAVKLFANIRNKDYTAAFVDQFSWIMIILGIGLIFMPFFVGMIPQLKTSIGLIAPTLSSIGKYMAIGGAALVVLFAGRSSRNVIKRVGSGLYSLYGITSYMSDILSYSRILALSLSSAVIASVMNLLAGMVQPTFETFTVMTIIQILFAGLIYIVGHIFNLMMGLLSAYVHASRLQYIEFFGKFYEGGGYEFKPLELKLKYIDEINVKN